MGRRKCKICSNWIDDNDDSIPYKQGYAHKKCFDVAMKVVTQEKRASLNKPNQVKEKPQKELKEGLTEEEYKEKVELCNYIRKLLGEDLSPKVYTLMEQYKKKFKITHAQMLQDLKWFFETEGNPVEGDVIGIIPYIHADAQRYLRQIDKAQNDCKAKINALPNMYPDKKILMPKIKPSNAKQIAMEDLILNSEVS